MTDLASLYGVGKGEAGIVDLRPTMQYSQNVREENIKKAENQQVERASKAKAINSLLGKLKVDGFRRHVNYLQTKLDDVNTWAMDEISKNGDYVFADNPDKAKELKTKIHDFVSLNTWSKSIATAAENQLKRLQLSTNDVTPESVAEFSYWIDQSPEYQKQHFMPIVKDVGATLGELLKKHNGTSFGNIKKIESSYSGKPSDKGYAHSSEDIGYDEKEFQTKVQDIYDNPNSPVTQKARRDAEKIIAGDGVIGKTKIVDGEEVNNPKFMQEWNKLTRELITEEARNLAPERSSNSGTAYKKSEENKSKEPILTPLGESGSGMKVTKPKEFNIKGVEEAYKDSNGKTFIKLSTDLWRKYDGTLTDKKEYGTGEVIPKGTIIDRNGNEPEDVNDLTRIESVKSFKTGKGFAIDYFKTTDLSAIPYAITEDGHELVPSSIQGLDKATINEYHKDVEYKKDGKRFIFKGDPEFKGLKKKTEVGDFVKVKTEKTKGKGATFTTIPYTEEVRAKFPDLAKKIEDIGIKDINSSDEKFIDIN